MKTRVVVGAVIVIVVMLASIGYYVMLSKPSVIMSNRSVTLQEPSADTLVPPIVIATPTPDSDTLGNIIARLSTDDINQAGLGLTVKPYIGDETTVIFSSLIYGKEPGGYNAYDIGYNDLLGTPDRLADPATLLVRSVGQYSNGGFNYAGYNNSQYDSLYNQQLSQLDLQKRKFLVDWMNQNYLENVAPIPLGYPVLYTAYNKGRITGVIPSGQELLANAWTYTNASSLVNSDTLTQAVITAGHGDVIPSTFNFFAYAQRAQGLQPMLLNGVYDTLLRNRPDGAVVSSLATGWTVLNSTNVIVQLRRDAKWTDGQSVTANDVAFSYNYIKSTGQPALLQPYISSLARVIVLDSTTVQFVLTNPNAPFITNTLTQIPILPQHIWDGLTQQQGVKNPSDLKLTTDMMVGSGPWKLVSFNYGSQVVFQSNPTYYLPLHYKTIRFVYFTSASVTITALEQGQIDIMPPGQELTPQEVKELGGYPSIQIVKIPTWTYWHLYINERKFPGADKTFRLALVHMINYQKIDDVAFGGALVRGVGFIAPMNIAWVDMPLINKMMTTIYNYDLTAAKKILSDAGYQWDSQGRLHYPPSLLSKGLAAAQTDNYKFVVQQSDVISTVPAPSGAPSAIQVAAVSLPENPTRKP